MRKGTKKMKKEVEEKEVKHEVKVKLEPVKEKKGTHQIGDKVKTSDGVGELVDIMHLMADGTVVKEPSVGIKYIVSINGVNKTYDSVQ